MTASHPSRKPSRGRTRGAMVLASWLTAPTLAPSIAPSIAWGSPPEDPLTEAPDIDDAPTLEVVDVRRFALVVGANDGGPGREVLRYAHSDARTMGRLLRDLGGVRSLDQIQLDDPTPAELREAFDRLAVLTRKAEDDGHRVQILFYYSGHSDEGGLLLGGASMGYKELRRRIEAIPAMVRIAILDSCASGAFTRLKGGTKRAPFLVSNLDDVAGHAFVTSSSEDEAAQESDRIGGSFFTHFFTSGLRGAADANRDRQVTLSEAYQFAFDETLARTEITRGGPQHAAYEIALSGSGDLVLTDLRKTTARLELTDEIAGRISVRTSRGDLVAELDKPKGAGPVLLALEPGRYRITVDDGKLWRADVVVAEDGRALLTPASLRPVPRERAQPRGDEDDEYVTVPFDIGLVPALSLNGRHRGKKIRNVGSVALLWSRVDRLDGIALSFGVSIVNDRAEGVQATLLGNHVNGRIDGAQLSNGYNHAATLRGVQASMVNHAKAVDGGVQFGIVNVGGRVRGAQFGLINVAKRSDASIGLVSVTKEGGVRAEVWTSDIAAFNLGIRLPARFTYSTLAIGLHPFDEGSAWLFGFGMGGHIPLPYDLFLDLDLLGHAVTSSLRLRPPFGGLGQVRALFGWQALDRLAIWAGPTFNVLVDKYDPMDANHVGRPGYGWVNWTKVDDKTRVRLWPGFAAGFRF